MQGIFRKIIHGREVKYPLSNSSLGLSIFPVTSLALRARYNVNDRLSFKAAILDGVPGDPNRPGTTAVIRLSNDEGTLGVFETSYKLDEGMLRAGYWHNSSGFDDIVRVDLNGNPLRNLTNNGFYLSAEHTIWKSTDGDKVSAFVRVGSREEIVATSERHLSLNVRIFFNSKINSIDALFSASIDISLV